MRPRIYISGPITKGDRNHNVYQAFDAQRRLMDAGFAPMNPMASCCYPFAWEPGYGAEEWLACYFPWVAVSDAVLRLPGESEGAGREVACAAKLGIPVYYDIGVLSKRFEAELLTPAESF